MALSDITSYITQSVIMLAGPQEPGADRRWCYWLGDGICLGSTGLEGYSCRVPGPSMPFDGSGDHESVHPRSEEAGAQVQVQNEGIYSANETWASSSSGRMSERKSSGFDVRTVDMFPECVFRRILLGTCCQARLVSGRNQSPSEALHSHSTC